MRTRPYERTYPHSDLLNHEARAVIEAEFVEIHPTPPRQPSTPLLKRIKPWIKLWLKRT